MNWRSVIVYWLSAALMGGWLYLDASRGTPVSTQATLNPLVTSSPSRFDQVVIDRADKAGGGRLEFARGGDGRWTVTSPPGMTITSDLLAALLDTLATIPPKEKLSDDGRGSAQFGLMPPEAQLVMRSKGETEVAIDIGKRNPTRTAVYAAIAGDEAVYLLGLNAQYYLELMFDEIARQRVPKRGR